MDNEQKNELSVLIRYKTKLIKWGVIAVVLIVAILAIFLKGYSSAKEKYEARVAELEQQIAELEKNDQPTKEIIIDLIKSKIKDIGELATIEYLYTDAGKFEDVKQAWGINIPFTSKSFITKWDGTIKAGIQVDQIVVDVNNANKEIIIHMPKAEILSHDVVKEQGYAIKFEAIE